MSDMRAYTAHIHARAVADELLMAHARGAAGSYNVKLALEAFGRLCAAVHDLTVNAPTNEAEA